MANAHLLRRLEGIQQMLMAVHAAGVPMSSASKGREREEFIEDFLKHALPQIYRFGTTEEPLCRHCAVKGHVTPATCVDHITPRRDGGKDEWDNTQSLCDDCHKAKTAEENRRWFGKWAAERKRKRQILPSGILVLTLKPMHCAI
jgi:5-methylcytosine-specific restriction endonuclease McrA